MPAGIVQGPGHDFLVGCGGHDGVQFPPLLIIFDGTCTTSAACVASQIKIDQSGGTDEVWYNPGDNRYYTAGTRHAQRTGHGKWWMPARASGSSM